MGGTGSTSAVPVYFLPTSIFPLEPEAELAAAMELLIHKLGSGPLSLQEAAAILQEEDAGFVGNVFARMEELELVAKEGERFRLR